MELNGRFYVDVTDFMDAIAKLIKPKESTESLPGMGGFSGEEIAMGGEQEAQEENVTFHKGPNGPQYLIPGELQDPPYTNVPRYQTRPEFTPPDGYVWTDHLWGWYARRKI